MALRYLFGPVSAKFAEQNLQAQRQAGLCLAFNAEGDTDLTIRQSDTWDDVRKQLAVGWEPDVLVLWLSYATVPSCLWSASLPRVGLATDWFLLWHYYRRRLAQCDMIFTDTTGAELLNRQGLAQARPAILCGAERAFLEATWPETLRDIDILFVGNLNPAVQRERMPWLARLARMGQRWRVVVRTRIVGESYLRLLARARIVCHHSAWHKCGRRAFEAAAAGALIFQEAANRELPALFRDRHECVFYQPDDLEPLLEHYLEHEEERLLLAGAARARVRDYSFGDFWERMIIQVAEELSPSPKHLHQGQPTPDPVGELLTRCWQAQFSSQHADTNLIGDLEKSVEAHPQSATLFNALGAVLMRAHHNSGAATYAAEVAAEYFRRAVDCKPNYVLAWLNLTVALDAAGQNLAAIDAAHRTLEILQRDNGLDSACLEGPLFGMAFETFGVEWERSAWTHADQPAAEYEAKHALLRWRLYTLLARWTRDTAASYEAALLRPDLPHAYVALGNALLRAGRPGEALTHLRHALVKNPFDREAARLLFQVLGAAGCSVDQQRLLEDRRLLSRAVPQVLPPEGWFAGTRLKGDELASIIVLCCNQLEYTRQCLESLLRHTRPPYELLLVDNGSTDGTPEYLEVIAQRSGPARVEIIRNDTNRGFPAGNNQALSRADGDYIVFLNNDTVLTPAWLDGLIAWSLHEWPEVGLVGAVSNYAPEPQGVSCTYTNVVDADSFAINRRNTFANKKLVVRRVTAFCLLARRDVIESVGGFDERFGTGFFDDDDLCVRVREAGYKLLVAQDVYVHHYGSRTFEAMGVDVWKQLEEKFKRFREKWGAEYAVGYRRPRPGPAPGSRAEGDGKDVAEAGLGEEQAAPTTAPIVPGGEEVESSSETAFSLPVEEPTPVEVVWPPSEELTITHSATRVRNSLCMIVRNEEYHLPDCLRSVAGLFDEIIVTDTGSTDKTREVAQSFGARVVDFPWVDSFGAARNASLGHATGQWIMWLDADDRLDTENREKLVKLLAELGDERDAYALKVRSVLDIDRTAFRLLDQVRLFRNRPEIRWDYRVHEQILGAVNRAGGGVRWADVVIDHVGYQDPKFRRGKLDRNLRLLELDHAERPDDAFTLFNLGWTVLDLGRTDEALRYLRQALEHTKPTSSTLRKLYHLLVLAHRNLGQHDEALSTCREALAKFQDDAELLCEEGLLLRDSGDLYGAEQSWLRLLDARRGQYFASEEVGLRGYKTRQLLAEIYRAQQRWIEADIQWRAALGERPGFEPAWTGLAELYLRTERWQNLEYLLQKLEGKGVTLAKLDFLRARGQFQRKEFAAARRTLEAVIAKDNAAIGPRVLLSHVLLQEGRDWPATERALGDVLTLDPNHAEAKHNLKLLLLRFGRNPIIT